LSARALLLPMSEKELLALVLLGLVVMMFAAGVIVAT
jgi:hypothetical protein